MWINLPHSLLVKLPMGTGQQFVVINNEQSRWVHKTLGTFAQSLFCSVVIGATCSLMTTFGGSEQTGRGWSEPNVWMQSLDGRHRRRDCCHWKQFQFVWSCAGRVSDKGKNASMRCRARHQPAASDGPSPGTDSIDAWTLFVIDCWLSELLATIAKHNHNVILGSAINSAANWSVRHVYPLLTSSIVYEAIAHLTMVYHATCHWKWLNHWVISKCTQCLGRVKVERCQLICI